MKVGGRGRELSPISVSLQDLESLGQRNLNGLFAILDPPLLSSKNLSLLKWRQSVLSTLKGLEPISNFNWSECLDSCQWKINFMFSEERMWKMLCELGGLGGLVTRFMLF